ncbi:MAG: ketoacyl-ACP synthase III [Desulfobulbaceae bacterium]|uniref:Beta-ketoacyl-[acyl-carrier-protein] synthase III n=1 Tax=Candidatus Desulfobia pelagia TaxID=2841692 RepID=A0A8J6NBB8_9BACT|nr:ketoacyl-ACP synthase III [Candidatus Desulfobia pelagia]
MNRMMIIGTGSALPERVLANSDLEKMVDTSDEWITSRSGIKTRHIAAKGEETSKLSTAAAMKALEMANIGAEDLDMIIVGTITSEISMPSCACLVQKNIGAVNAFAFDINSACCGFLYGLDIAEKYIKTNPDMHVLVIGAENLSARVNWQDRNTCVLFGDGAGAAVVSGSSSGRGMIGGRMYSDGRLHKLLWMNSAPSMNPALAIPDHDGSYIKMAGRDVFKYAVRALSQAVTDVLDQEGFDLADVNIVVPHQANIRILKSLADRLDIPLEKLYINVYKYGNTSAASIPIALDEANRAGLLPEGEMILLCAFGGGFTWGASLLRW